MNKFYKKYWWLFLIGILVLVGVDYLNTVIPEQLGNLVGLFQNVSDVTEIAIENVARIIIYLLGASFLIMLGRMGFRLTIFRASHNIEAGLRYEMFLKAERLSQTYYHSTKVGTIMAWFTTDLETIEEFLGWGTVMLVDAFFMSVFVIVKMFVLNWALSLVAFVPILLIVIWGALVEKFMAMKWKERQAANDEIYDFSQEVFTGIRVIKAFVKETKELHAFSKIARKNQKINVNFARISILFDVLIQIIINVSLCVILGCGGYLVYLCATGTPFTLFGQTIVLQAKELVTFIGYFDTLIWPVIALGQIITMRSRSKASLERISNFLDENEDIVHIENPIKIVNPQGKISFNNFSFTYPTNNNESLKNISLEINPGESIGVVGKIGSGKSTLMNSLLHLYNIEENAILIDDVDLMKIDITDLRNLIAFVPQDNFLFSDKIKNNISFGSSEVSQEEIENAAKFSDVHENIMNFPNQYDEICGEQGVTLSGGQKQRVSISRAFIRNAPIMILDDSVSAVDTKTEETIIKNIHEQRKGKTTILISSRVSTVAKMDRIIVLNNGEVEAFGSHNELLKSSPTYSRMVTLQKLEEEVEGGN
ncbi:MAG: ABC transporter ATP-binding protein/permease [Bacilli bacterium]|nr:ABC transporter ATP-binding protein/permease [Bacilli bacterium]